MMYTLEGYKAVDRMRNAVRDNSALLPVIGRFGILLGFGDKTIREVCREYNVDEKTFLEVINSVSGRRGNYKSVSLPALISYLKQAHAYYLDFVIPNIRRKLIEAIDCSGTNDIAILILRFYDEYVAEVRKHMDYEDKFVFTYVDRLLKGFLAVTTLSLHLQVSMRL